ncbi:UNVERIFIED_CONTAM: 3-ketoacyl-CoA synthase 17 [Sesamum indicum]
MCQEEAEMVICAAIDDLFCKNPSETKRYWHSCSYRQQVQAQGEVVSCNLGGMGCSAGLIAIDLAKPLLQVQPKTCALIMSSECMTSNYYAGKDRTKMLPNCLFRVGGATILLSNRFADRRRSKYELIHTLRTHKGADDRAYKCVFQEEDEAGNLGVSLSKDLIAAAGQTLKENIKALGPLVCNTSSSSICYSLASAEAKGRIRKGHRVWQIAPRSGFKSNSGVWCALKTFTLHRSKIDGQTMLRY